MGDGEPTVTPHHPACHVPYVIHLRHCESSVTDLPTVDRLVAKASNLPHGEHARIAPSLLGNANGREIVRPSFRDQASSVPSLVTMIGWKPDRSASLGVPHGAVTNPGDRGGANGRYSVSSRL